MTSGIIATTFLNSIDYLSLRLHMNKWHIWQISTSLFFPQNELSTVPALILGAVTHATIMGLAGTSICYTLYYSGRTLYILKGIAILLLFGIILFGGALSLKITSIIQPVGAQTNMGHLFGHLMEGTLTSLLIVKLADKQVWDRSFEGNWN